MPNLSQLLHITHGFGVRPEDILLNEVVHDAAEFFLEIECVERNVEPVGNPLGIGRVAGRAAALLLARSLSAGGKLTIGTAGPLFAGASGGDGFAMTHEQADYLVAGLAQQVPSDTAVDPPDMAKTTPAIIRPRVGREPEADPAAPNAAAAGRTNSSLRCGGKPDKAGGYSKAGRSIPRLAITRGPCHN